MDPGENAHLLEALAYKNANARRKSLPGV